MKKVIYISLQLTFFFVCSILLICCKKDEKDAFDKFIEEYRPLADSDFVPFDPKIAEGTYYLKKTNFLKDSSIIIEVNSDHTYTEYLINMNGKTITNSGTWTHTRSKKKQREMPGIKLMPDSVYSELIKVPDITFNNFMMLDTQRVPHTYDGNTQMLLYNDSILSMMDLHSKWLEFRTFVRR